MLATKTSRKKPLLILFYWHVIILTVSSTCDTLSFRILIIYILFSNNGLSIYTKSCYSVVRSFVCFRPWIYNHSAITVLPIRSVCLLYRRNEVVVNDNRHTTFSDPYSTQKLYYIGISHIYIMSVL